MLCEVADTRGQSLLTKMHPDRTLRCEVPDTRGWFLFTRAHPDCTLWCEVPDTRGGEVSALTVNQERDCMLTPHCNV